MSFRFWITSAFVNRKLGVLGSRLVKVTARNGVVRWCRVPLDGYPEGGFEPQWGTLCDAWDDLKTLRAFR